MIDMLLKLAFSNSYYKKERRKKRARDSAPEERARSTQHDSQSNEGRGQLTDRVCRTDEPLEKPS